MRRRRSALPPLPTAAKAAVTTVTTASPDDSNSDTMKEQVITPTSSSSSSKTPTVSSSSFRKKKLFHSIFKKKKSFHSNIPSIHEQEHHQNSVMPSCLHQSLHGFINNNDQHRQRQIDRSSLLTLGTIDLSSDRNMSIYDEDDDDDEDDNHGLSSCGSAIRLEISDLDASTNRDITATNAFTSATISSTETTATPPPPMDDCNRNYYHDHDHENAQMLTAQPCHDNSKEQVKEGTDDNENDKKGSEVENSSVNGEQTQNHRQQHQQGNVQDDKDDGIGGSIPKNDLRHQQIQSTSNVVYSNSLSLPAPPSRPIRSHALQSSSTETTMHNIHSIPKLLNSITKVKNGNQIVNTNVATSKCTLTRVHDDEKEENDKHQQQKQKQFQNDQKGILHEKKKVASLYELGKEYYTHGSYKEALSIQNEALKLVHHIANVEQVMLKRQQEFMSSTIIINTQERENAQQQDEQQHQRLILYQQQSKRYTCLYKRQAAMIEYEIAKIEFVISKEMQYHSPTQQSSSSSPLSSPSNSHTSPNVHEDNDIDDDDKDAQLSILFDRMQNAKCIVALQEYSFYKDELSSMENRLSLSKLNTNTITTTETSSTISPTTTNNNKSTTAAGIDTYLQTSNDNRANHNQQFHGQTLEKLVKRIDVLSILGKICHKNIHRYDDALRYYNEVSRLEFCVLSSLANEKVAANINTPVVKSTTTSPNRCNDEEGGIEREICVWKIRIQQTKKKIGAIYYLIGRFDLALISSFSQ